MAVIKTDFPDLLIIEPVIYGDDRGYFFEAYNEKTFSSENVNIKFIQDNQARSIYGVVRGLHFQENPYAQTKLIRVLEGVIFDVVVDLRKNSPSFGKVFTIELSAQNKKQLLVPKGFAHGYSVLSNTAEVFYKCDEFYHKECEGSVLYSDPYLNIDWRIPTGSMILSSKDLASASFESSKHDFLFEG
jgi:dTDP-4-dehydrorhamnose 3,5-epimerase